MAVFTQHFYLKEAQLNHEFAGCLGQNLYLPSFKGALEFRGVTGRMEIQFALVGY